MAKIVSLRGSIEQVGDIIRNLSQSISCAETLYASRYELAASAADESVSLGHITTVSVLMIHTDVPISYKINGYSDAIIIGTAGTHVLFNTSVTALTLTESNGVPALVDIFLGGT